MSESKSKKSLSPREIECWTPPSLRYVVGCSEVKEHFADMLRVDGFGPNTLITGAPRTGKTAIVRAYLRTLMCPDRNLYTLDVCGNCQSCMHFNPSSANVGVNVNLFARAEARYAPIHYVPVDCSAITTEQWEQCMALLQEVMRRNEANHREDLTVVYLDDFHYLKYRGLMGSLLHYIDELNVVWIASARLASAFSQEVLNLFAGVLSTTLATPEEFLGFVQDRCHEWGVKPHDRVSLILLAHYSKLLPSLAISFLASTAGKEDRTFDGADVENYFRDENNGDDA